MVVPWAVRATNLIYNISLVFGGVIGLLTKETFFPRYLQVVVLSLHSLSYVQFSQQFFLGYPFEINALVIHVSVLVVFLAQY